MAKFVNVDAAFVLKHIKAIPYEVFVLFSQETTRYAVVAVG